MTTGTVAATFVMALFLAPGDKGAPLFEDRFDGKLADGWSWVREDKGDWRVEGGALRIRATPGNLWEKENTARNILLRPPPKDARSFVAEVTVAHGPVTFGEQAGLVWYADDDNYVKLVKEFYDGKTWVVLAAETAGKAAYKESPCAGETVTLRLSAFEDKVTGEFKLPDADRWTPIGPLPFKAARAKIGLNAHHAPAGAQRWAVFKRLTLRPAK